MFIVSHFFYINFKMDFQNKIFTFYLTHNLPFINMKLDASTHKIIIKYLSIR